MTNVRWLTAIDTLNDVAILQFESIRLRCTDDQKSGIGAEVFAEPGVKLNKLHAVPAPAGPWEPELHREFLHGVWRERCSRTMRGIGAWHPGEHMHFHNSGRHLYGTHVAFAQVLNRQLVSLFNSLHEIQESLVCGSACLRAQRFVIHCR